MCDEVSSSRVGRDDVVAVR